MSSDSPGSGRWILVAALTLAALLAACNGGAGLEDDEILVVATTSVLGDIATHVVDQEGRVEVLIPIGVDAHDFRASSQQATLIAGADLVVANGLGLEQGLIDVLDSAAVSGTTVIELGPLVDPIMLVGGEGNDPHFWMDPIRAGDAAVALADALTGQNPDGSWSERAGDYVSAMAAADSNIAEILAVVPPGSRRMVTNHEAFGYFADRYRFEVIGGIIPGGSTLAEPSSAELAGLVEAMEEVDVRVIFAETSSPTNLADALAAELGEDVEVVELFTESLGPPGSGAETLAGMLVTNAQRVASSLG